MALHKMIGGEQVPLSPSEEAAQVSEWAAAKTDQDAKVAERTAKNNRRKVGDVGNGLPATNAKVQEIIDVLRESGIYLTP